MRQKLAIGGNVDLLSREEFDSGISGIVAGLVALRQPPEKIWWPFELTADSAGNIGAGVSASQPGTIYLVPQGFSVSLHFIGYTVAGVNPSNPVTTAGQWTEVCVDGIQNQPGVWFTPTGPGGWVAPTQQRWGSEGPVFHEGQRVTLCGVLAANAVVTGQVMMTLLARAHNMATRLAGARSGVPAPLAPGTGVPGGPIRPSTRGQGYLNPIGPTRGASG